MPKPATAAPPRPIAPPHCPRRGSRCLCRRSRSPPPPCSPDQPAATCRSPACAGPGLRCAPAHRDRLLRRRHLAPQRSIIAAPTTVATDPAVGATGSVPSWVPAARPPPTPVTPLSVCVRLRVGGSCTWWWPQHGRKQKRKHPCNSQGADMPNVWRPNCAGGGWGYLCSPTQTSPITRR